MVARRGRRITDFFRPERPATARTGSAEPLPAPDVQGLEAEAEALPAPSLNTAHPYFVLNGRKRREASLLAAGRDTERGRHSPLKSCPLDAPLHPPFRTGARVSGLGEAARAPRCRFPPRAAAAINRTAHADLEYVQRDAHRRRRWRRQWLRPRLQPEPARPAASQARIDLIASTIVSWVAAQDQIGKEAAVGDAPFEKGRQVVQKGSVVLLTGPPGSGKTRAAAAVAQKLVVPLTEINAAVPLRTGKSFDDIQSATHAERSALRRFVSAEDGNAGPGPAQRTKMVVLVDEVDLVFAIDRFYTPLNAFLRRAADSILVILTCNAGERLMRTFIDLPPGTLCLDVGVAGHAACADRPADLLLATALSDEDVLLSMGRPTIGRADGAAPLCCVPFDVLGGAEPLFGEGARCETAEGRGADALLGELHRAGVLLRCSSPDWALDYRPYWRDMEERAARQRVAPAPRTVRPARHCGHVAGVPARLLERLRSGPNKHAS